MGPPGTLLWGNADPPPEGRRLRWPAPMRFTCEALEAAQALE